MAWNYDHRRCKTDVNTEKRCGGRSCKENFGRQRGERIISKTIGLFYLCYAKLVTEYPKQKWLDYLRENNIGWEEETEIVEELSKAYQGINLCAE